MERDRIELRAEEYSRDFRARGRGYVFLGREQRRFMPGLEPRNPLLLREDVIAWQRREPLEERFWTLVRSWKKEIAFESSLTEILMNHNYLKIIGLGPHALPLILEALQREPDMWFLALESIAGEDPAASEENTGDFKKISEIWLEWGRDRGFI
jgi:hypothetical protein